MPDRIGENLRLPHFAPKAKRAIYLFMSGGPPQIDLLDYKPNLAAQFRQGHAGLRARQPAVDRHDRRPGALSHRAFALALQAVWADGNVGQRSAALHGAHGRRSDDHQIDQHRRHQSRAGHHADEYRQHECRQAVPGLVAGVWAGQHERQPAHVHRSADQD